MAGTSAEVRTAWEENLWAHASVLAMTDKIFMYDVSKDSQFDISTLYYAESDSAVPTINFFLCLVQRQTEQNQVAGGGAGSRYTFEVRVEYYLQQTDAASSTYNTLIDRLETVDTLVRTALGASWDSTVDYWTGGVPTRVSTAEIDDRTCWRGTYTYTGVKTV